MPKMGYVYILTNKRKTVLYVGVTNNLNRRLAEHVSKPSGFVEKYNVQFLVYQEAVFGMTNAIKREKELKGWIRAKKEALIESVNPEWTFLNDEVLGE